MRTINIVMAVALAISLIGMTALASANQGLSPTVVKDSPFAEYGSNEMQIEQYMDQHMHQEDANEHRWSYQNNYSNEENHTHNHHC